LGFALIFLWIIPLFGGSWIAKDFSGIGAKYFRIRTSLSHMKVEVQCGKNILEDQVCKAFKKVNGDHSLRDAMDMTCVITQSVGKGVFFTAEACNLMTQQFYMSFVPMLAFFSSASFYGFALGFMYYYWHVDHIAKAREWGKKFYCIAPIPGIIGLVLFAFCSPDLSLFANSLMPGGSVMGGTIEETDPISYGSTFFFACFTAFLSIISVMIWSVFFRQHPGEPDAEEARAEENYYNQLLLDEVRYGATAQQPMMQQPMYQDPMMMQQPMMQQGGYDQQFQGSYDQQFQGSYDQQFQGAYDQQPYPGNPEMQMQVGVAPPGAAV
jgi:hypothetical protein